MHLSQRTTRISGSKTSGTRNKAEALRAQGVEVVNFAAGELDFAAPEELRRAVREAADGATNRYTDTAGLPELRAALAERISRLAEVRYAPNEVIVTTGAKHGLYLVCLTLLDPGDEALIPQPSWGTFTAQVQMAGAVPVPVETYDTGFVPSLERLEMLRTSRTRMIVLNSPNNPTGVVYPPRTLARIAEWAVRHGVWVLFDECYGELVLPGVKHAHSCALFTEARKNVVAVGSFSKSFAVTGWRAGHVHGPAPVIAAMENLQSHTTSNVTSIVQHALLPAARGELDAFVAEVGEVLRKRHAMVKEALDATPHVTAADPQGAFYFFLNFRGVIGRKLCGAPVPDTDALAGLLLEHAHIVLTPGSAFGAEDFMRLSYAISEDLITEGLANLKQVMSSVE